MHAFASLSGVFSLFSPLNILHTLSLSLLSVCCACRVFRRFTPQARCHPCPSLLPSACPPSAPACCVFRGCRVCPVVSPSVSPSPWLAPPAFCVCALKLSGGLLWIVLCVVLLPSLVSYQAQNAMTVGTDAPRVCPRPYLLLPMCCRVFRRLFRCPFRGLSCCLLPCVVWW